MVGKTPQMQKKCLSHFLLALLFLVASMNNISCQRQQSLADKEFTQVFADISMNRELELQVIIPSDVFQELNPVNISLMLINNSQGPIEISTNIRLFYFSENTTWLEIINLSSYTVPTFTLSSADGELVPGKTIITVLPDSRETGNINEIRVVVIGEIDQGENQPKKQVGAFIDIPINK